MLFATVANKTIMNGDARRDATHGNTIDKRQAIGNNRPQNDVGIRTLFLAHSAMFGMTLVMENLRGDMRKTWLANING